MQVSTMFVEYLKLCPLRPNKRISNMPCNENKPNKIYKLQITEVSNSVKRHADKSGNRQNVKPVTSNELQAFSEIFPWARLIRHVLYSILSA